jgi:hypothetical protein
MTDTLPLSSRIYNRFLILYPEDLRRDYGPEMALVFADDLDAARREEGLRGVLRVWRCALGEFLRLALPVHAAHPAVRVPAISLAVFICATSAEMAMAYPQAPNLPMFFHAVGMALALPFFVSPVISLFAVWSCRGEDAISLGLVDPPAKEHHPCSKSAN